MEPRNDDLIPPRSGDDDPTGVLESGVGAVPSVGWDDFKRDLQWSFLVHVYAFAFLFFMLSFYTFFSILNLRSQISTRPFMSTINAFVCLMGLSRAACLVTDPYSSSQVLPGAVERILWDLEYPCIVSAFSLIQLAFTQLTQMKFRPNCLRKKAFLRVAMICHFGFVVASNVVVGFDDSLQVVRLVSQIIFLSWGVILCSAFVYGGAKMLRLLDNLPDSIFQSKQSTQGPKGILQLALLSQCSNVASSMITAAAATSSIIAPKIKITHDAELPEENRDAEPQTSSKDLWSDVKAETSRERPRPAVTIEVIEPSSVDSSRSQPTEEERESAEINVHKKSLSWEDQKNVRENSADGDGIPEKLSGATLGHDISSKGKYRKNYKSSAESSSLLTTSTKSGELGEGNYRSRNKKTDRDDHANHIVSSSKSKGTKTNDIVISSNQFSKTSRKPNDDVNGAPDIIADDVTLVSVLNHIAYVNQTKALKPGINAKGTRKEQIKQVLIVTYVLAFLGMALSVLMATSLYLRRPPDCPVQAWVWFAFECCCRLLEFLIGCAMANITRQPVNRATPLGLTIGLNPLHI